MKVLHQIGIIICDPHHNFLAIQGTDFVTGYLKFCTLLEGVCTDLFPISDSVCRSDLVRNKNYSNNAPTSSYDEI